MVVVVSPPSQLRVQALEVKQIRHKISPPSVRHNAMNRLPCGCSYMVGLFLSLTLYTFTF